MLYRSSRWVAGGGLTIHLGLIHLGIALAVVVLGRAWCMINGSVDDGALAQRQAFFLQIAVDDRGLQEPGDASPAGVGSS